MSGDLTVIWISAPSSGKIWIRNWEAFYSKIGKPIKYSTDTFPQQVLYVEQEGSEAWQQATLCRVDNIPRLQLVNDRADGTPSINPFPFLVRALESLGTAFKPAQFLTDPSGELLGNDVEEIHELLLRLRFMYSRTNTDWEVARGTQ